MASQSCMYSSTCTILYIVLNGAYRDTSLPELTPPAGPRNATLVGAAFSSALRNRLLDTTFHTATLNNCVLFHNYASYSYLFINCAISYSRMLLKIENFLKFFVDVTAGKYIRIYCYNLTCYHSYP
jgi:hypothetical protein